MTTSAISLKGKGQWRPACYPRVVYTLRWGLLGREHKQDWILRSLERVVADVDGYPVGQTPIYAPAAREWADTTLGSPQDWIEQPTRSGAFHAHA